MTRSKPGSRFLVAGILLLVVAAVGGAACSSFSSEPGSGDDGGSPDAEAGAETAAEAAPAADGGAFGAAVLLVEDDGGAMTLAIDDDTVFWAGLPPALDGGDRWRIRRRAKVGGDFAYIPSGLSSGPNVIAIAPSVTRVVWSEGNGGCTGDAVSGYSYISKESEYLPVLCAGRLFQTGATIYASSPNGDAGALRAFDKLKVLGSSGTVVANGPWTGPLVSDDKSIYAATPTDIVKVTINGGDSSPFVAMPGVIDLALGGTDLFIATATTLSVTSLKGGQPVKLADSQHPLRIALDPASLYWIDGTGRQIMRVSRTGGSVEKLAATQGEPTGLAVDERALYWSTAAGKIFELARR